MNIDWSQFNLKPGNTPYFWNGSALEPLDTITKYTWDGSSMKDSHITAVAKRADEQVLEHIKACLIGKGFAHAKNTEYDWYRILKLIDTDERGVYSFLGKCGRVPLFVLHRDGPEVINDKTACKIVITQSFTDL